MISNHSFGMCADCERSSRNSEQRGDARREGEGEGEGRGPYIQRENVLAGL